MVAGAVSGRQYTNPDMEGWEGFDPSLVKGFYPNEIASDFAYIPFGGGIRKCVGDQFAIMESTVRRPEFLAVFGFLARLPSAHQYWESPLLRNNPCELSELVLTLPNGDRTGGVGEPVAPVFVRAGVPEGGGGHGDGSDHPHLRGAAHAHPQAHEECVKCARHRSKRHFTNM
eukprot:1189206-Prorocentrum_minimum.AAC.1